MNSQIQIAFVVASMVIGCAMQPLGGHDPSAGKLGGRNPLNAINEVVRSREQRKLEGQCFIRLTQAAKTEHRDGCSGPVNV